MLPWAKKPSSGSKANPSLRFCWDGNSIKEGQTPPMASREVSGHGSCNKATKGFTLNNKVDHQEATAKQGTKRRHRKVFLFLGVAQGCTKELLLPWGCTGGAQDFCWAHKASVQMSFSPTSFVLKGLGTQKKGQRQRLWSLALRASLWKPASTSAIVLIFFFFHLFFFCWARNLGDGGVRAHIHSSWHFCLSDLQELMGWAT